MNEHESADRSAAVNALKAQYVVALRNRSEAPSAEGPASDAGLRVAYDKREREFFLDRLRFRLRKLGLSSREIEALEKEPEVSLKSVGPAPTRSILQHVKTAILVIHGIGEQKPYETLDQFARNLTRYLRYEGGIDDLVLSAQKIDHNDWVEAMIRLETAKHGPRAQEGQQRAYVDLYEYYWAPETEDKISYKQTIAWLIKTTLTPIRMLDQNITAIENETHTEGLSRSAILYRELRRIAYLYIPLVVYWVVLKELVAKAFRRLRQQTAMVSSWVTTNTFAAGALLILSGLGIGYLFNVNLAQYVNPVLNVHIVFALAALGVAKVIQLFLVNFVGDIAVYVNADAKAKNFAARRAVLNGAVSAINRILKDRARAYENVIVAGHSLGSVIAYDSLNELMNRCQTGGDHDQAIYATPDQIVGDQPAGAAVHRGDLARIRGLVTFGSPLDKVHYFFREYVPENESARAQILSLLRSFRTRPSGSDYGIYRLEPYVANQLNNVKWLNAWSKQDPVSGMLHFYAPVTRQHFGYLIPIYAP